MRSVPSQRSFVRRLLVRDNDTVIPRKVAIQQFFEVDIERALIRSDRIGAQAAFGLGNR